MTRDDMKRAAAAAAIEYVQPGMTIGVGTGSTADWFVTLLSELPPHRRQFAEQRDEPVGRAPRAHPDGHAGLHVLDGGCSCRALHVIAGHGSHLPSARPFDRTTR